MDPQRFSLLAHSDAPVAVAPIVTVTPNPAIDEGLSLEVLEPDAINRCRLDGLDPGGKGVNASRMIARLGHPTIALGFAGGAIGELLRQRLTAEGVPHDFVTVRDLTRINVMLFERTTGRRTRLYLPGAAVTPADLRALEERLSRVPPGCVVTFGGSLPPGLADEACATLISGLRARGVRTVADLAGRALVAALREGPDLIKPNVDEAATLLGRALVGDDAVLAAAYELQARGASNVVISQGREGAIGVGPGGAWKAVAPTVETRSTIGSGDSMVAGLAIALAQGWSLADGLRLGTAAGAATAMTPGTQLGRAEDVRRLQEAVGIRVLAGVPNGTRIGADRTSPRPGAPATVEARDLREVGA